ncbi:MAG TPA: hypothetical protein VKB61_14760, partial [Candidatus Acidoferrum sp.]|nr:hypothetical protein [Candidatus Acidoferrum sp.]
WFGHAAFGEDSGDVAARRDVESRMRSRDIRRASDALNVGDFILGALLDGNVFTYRVSIGRRFSTLSFRARGPRKLMKITPE